MHLFVQYTFCSLYECEIGNAPQLIKNWIIGPLASHSPSKIPNFISLGEYAVDFDFATATLKNLPDSDNEERMVKI